MPAGFSRGNGRPGVRGCKRFRTRCRTCRRLGLRAGRFPRRIAKARRLLLTLRMRVIAPLIVLTLILAGLIGLRLHRQAQALAAPSGGSGEIEGTTVDLSSRVGARISRRDR